MSSESVKKEKKKEEIANAAFRLFMKNGYSSTKIADIADETNIGKGTVYEYFKSKDDILLYVILNNITREFSDLPELIAQHDSFYDKLKVYIDFEVAFSNKFGRYATEVKQLVVEPMDVKLSKEIRNAICDLIQFEYKIVFDIIEYGIGGNRIRNMNKMLATHFIVGLSSIYAALKCGVATDLGIPIPEEFWHEIENYTVDDIIDLIKNGIGI